MAHILIIDDSEVACLALRGILTERGHQATIVSDVGQAWRSLHETDGIDLVVAELKLKTEGSQPFIQRVRGNGMFRALPILVYTSVSDMAVVRNVLALRPQNYLLKPYRAELIQNEIEKALSTPWRDAVEDENTFSANTGIDLPSLKQQRFELGSALYESIGALSESLSGGTALLMLPRLKAFVETAERVGAPRVASYLKELVAEAEAEHWWTLKDCGPTIDYASRLLRGHSLAVGPAIDAAPVAEEEIPRDRIFWLAAEAAGSFPLDRKRTEAEIEGLKGCPVIDTVAAAFVMATEGSHSNLGHLNDLVSQDASLAATVLMAANHLAREGDLNPIEDTGTAVSMLGDVKLASLTRSIPQVSERSLQIPPLSWPQFRLFQLGVSRMSEFVRRALEIKELEAVAGIAGLLHDAGQMLLMRIYPHGFKSMVEYSANHRLELDQVQRRFLGVSARGLAGTFFAHEALPPFFCSVIQHVNSPGDAPAADADLVAIVSLARHLCLQNDLGVCCDRAAKRGLRPVEETDAWRILSQRAFPSFNLSVFEKRARDHCENLKLSLATGGFSTRPPHQVPHPEASRPEPWRM
jgi:CheY-like chemotaxis protein/HD-like signal output (HDOD) protein